MIFLSFYYTIHSVKKLYLLKGGNSLGLITYGILGKEMNFKLNLAETSFMQKRIDRAAEVIIFKYLK